MIPGPVLRISECVRWALRWIIETGTGALLGPLLILPEPVHVKLVLLKPSYGANDKPKSPPICFVCSKPDSKHFLMDCEIFNDLSPKSRRQTVIEAKRCLNCLSLDHIVRNCPRSTKCRKCGPRSQNKHATALHECFISPNTGAADKGSDEPGSKNETTQNERNERVVLKANSLDKRVILLRTSAVKIVNPHFGQVVSCLCPT